MHTRYYKEYSHHLNRDMEFKVYGHAGLPMVVFPCQDGKYFDFEDRGMVETVRGHIENGLLQIFCVGCVDEETWSASAGDHHGRIMWHEQWVKYICEEFLPRLHQIHAETDPTSYEGRVMLSGASMGGYHCVNFYLRRPDLFGLGHSGVRNQIASAPNMIIRHFGAKLMSHGKEFLCRLLIINLLACSV